MNSKEAHGSCNFKRNVCLAILCFASEIQICMLYRCLGYKAKRIDTINICLHYMLIKGSKGQHVNITSLLYVYILYARREMDIQSTF